MFTLIAPSREGSLEGSDINLPPKHKLLKSFPPGSPRAARGASKGSDILASPKHKLPKALPLSVGRA